tara:strand:- start:33 stop:314 length:282 start_codon:yes stop_codon:yes gene_type:complete
VYVNQLIYIATQMLELSLVPLEATMQSLAFARRVHATEHIEALPNQIRACVVFIEPRIECGELRANLTEIRLEVAQARFHDHEARDDRHKHPA